jgi:CMP-N-acetylneuraminic acid synthetase
MKVLGIIPARAGSKRVPGKNLRLLGGKPLALWAIEAGRAAKRVDRLIVSSDDPRVLALARGLDERLALERPPHLATDTAPAIAYVHHALASLEARGEGPYDATVILQPSSPLTLPSDIDGTVRLLEQTGADSAVSIVLVEHAVHPLKLKRLEGSRLLPLIEEEGGRMAAHELPPVYVRNCAVYATARRVIDAGDIIGTDSRGYLMPRERSVDINDELDLMFAEFLLARKTFPDA